MGRLAEMQRKLLEVCVSPLDWLYYALTRLAFHVANDGS